MYLRRVSERYNNSCITLIIFLRDMRSIQVLYFIDFRYYDGDNKNRPGRTNRIPFIVGRGIFPHKSESQGPFEPTATALVIAVNQFRHEIDGKSQFHRRSPFSCSFSFFLSYLSFPVFLAPSELPLSFSFMSPLPDVYATPVRPRKSWNSIDRVILWALGGWIKVSSWKSYVLTLKCFSQQQKVPG